MKRTIALAAAGLLATTTGTAFGVTDSNHHTNGRARAIAEDKALLADAPTLPAAVRAATAPVKILDGAPLEPAEDQLVHRAKYWTVDEPYQQAYSDLTTSALPGLTISGTGRTGGPKPSDDEVFQVYDPKSLPAGIASAELTIAVAPISKTTSGIGVYAQAVPQPPRPAQENVPTSVRRVLVTKVTSSKDKHPIQRTITGPRARALVTAFDALKVEPAGESSCGEDHGQSKTASFTSGGNTWTASIGACYDTAVVRDGKALPTLTTTTRFYNELTKLLARHHPKRPAAEHVPLSLHTAHLATRTPPGAISRRRTVTGSKAASLVKAFDALAVVPKNSVHCNTVGGPQNIARFRTPHHVWVATESACTNILVTRDGTRLPTLLGSKAWEKLIHHYLGR